MNVRTRTSVLIALAAVVLLGGGCKSKEETGQRNNEGLLVKVGEVKATDLTYRLERVGSLEAKESVLLKAEAAGRVTDILFEEGDWVKEGQLLVKIDDAKIKTILNQLSARLKQVEVQLANNEKTLERKQPLVEQELVSKQDYDDLLASTEVLKATRKEVQAQRAHNQELLKDTEVRAPFAGATSARLISIGDFVKIGAPIVKLVQMNPVEISFRVDEKYKQRLSLRQPLTLKVSAYPDREFAGEVCFISPDIDIATRTFLVKGRIANSDHLLNPGMFAEVSIATETRRGALVVPWDSIIQLEDETYLYVVNGSSAKKVPVTLGVLSGGTAEIFGALAAGEKVVTEGKHALQDGVKVKIISPAQTS